MLCLESRLYAGDGDVMVTCAASSHLGPIMQARVALSDAGCEYLRVAGIGGARALAAEAVPYVLHELYGGRSSVTSQQAVGASDGATAVRPSKKQKRAMKACTHETDGSDSVLFTRRRALGLASSKEVGLATRVVPGIVQFSSSISLISASHRPQSSQVVQRCDGSPGSQVVTACPDVVRTRRQRRSFRILQWLLRWRSATSQRAAAPSPRQSARRRRRPQR